MEPRSALSLAALLACAACGPTPPPRPIPPNACPVPWPGDTTYLLSGQAAITFKNEMSKAFRIQRLVLTLDDALLCSRTTDAKDKDAEIEAGAIPVLSGPLREGEHEIKVLMTLRGHGEGVFSYLSGYKFEVRSSRTFHVTREERVETTVIAYEKGGPTTALEERPGIRYVERVSEVSDRR